MAGLGYVTVDNRVTYNNYGIPTDESCCGILFDYGLRPDPFEQSALAKERLGDRQVVKLTYSGRGEEYGIDTDFMGGIPHYHISQFFDYAGENAYVYVMFADCSSDFEAIQDFQYKLNGKLFQVGVWTEQHLWTTDNDGNYIFTDLPRKLQYQAEELGGRVGVLNETFMPLSIILCANTAFLKDISDVDKAVVQYRKIPDGLELECPKVSVLLGQNGTQEVHRMQASNMGYCPVGMIGLAMACLYEATAEKSIGSVMKFNLNKNDNINDVELGFGNVTNDILKSDYTKIDSITRTRANIISQRGYIIPVKYNGKEAEVFFSNDQTLSHGDYRLISLNRIMNKCRRILRGVLLPYLNGGIYYDSSTKSISATSISSITNEIIEKLDAKMIATDDGSEQILGREVYINPNQDVIKNDGIEIELSVIPANISDVIKATETSGDNIDNL